MHSFFRLTFILFLSLTFLSPACGQSPDMAALVYADYDRYREASINTRRFHYEDIEPVLQRVNRHPDMQVRKVGESVEGRPINLVRYGNGPVKVLLWSQMHGNESTATMVLMDLFNYFLARDGEDAFRDFLKKELTLYFLPMLNPDGAANYSRYNALWIDVNRDAARLQTPEGKLLKRIRDEVDADWGFNLHDQQIYYSAGRSPNSATFSFLAPAYDVDKTVNRVRERSMQLIVELNKWLQGELPAKVGRYDDTFEPRAFGDNMQKWGTSTILIECGGLEGDPEKQRIRRIHFGLLLQALESIAGGSYNTHSMVEYFSIPGNSSALIDLLIREARLEKNGQSYLLDIGFKKNEINADQATDYYERAYISEIGDLSTSYGYDEVDARGMEVRPGKLYPRTLSNISELESLDFRDLHRQGYTEVRLINRPKAVDRYDYPVMILRSNRHADNEVRLGNNASLVLYKNGEVQSVVVNGELYEVAGY